MESSTTSERLAGLPTRELPGGLRVAEARGRRARMRGLARLDDLPPDEALLIPRCSSVHTFGMRFALDLVFVDRRGRVVRVERDVKPRRLRWVPRARSVLETRSGEADRFLAAGFADPPAG